MLKEDKHYPEDFYPITLYFEELGDRLNNYVSYCAGHMKGAYRESKNYIPGTMNLLIFDIDDSITINETKQLLTKYTYLIITTSNHQKEKNGVICDRFRLIFPMDSILRDCDEKHYKAAYDKVASDLNLPIDNATKDIARYYAAFKGAKTVYNKGIKFPFNNYIEKMIMVEEIKKQNKIKSRVMCDISNSNNITPSKLKNNDKFKHYYGNIVTGNIHRGMMEIIGYFKKSGCEKEDVREWLKQQFPSSAENVDKRMRVW